MKLKRFRPDRSVSDANGKLALSSAWRVGALEAYFAGPAFIATSRRPMLLGFKPFGQLLPVDRDVIAVVEGDGYPLTATAGVAKSYRQTPTIHPLLAMESIEELAADQADAVQARGASASVTAMRWAAAGATILFAAVFVFQLVIGAGPGALDELSGAVAGLGGVE